MNAMKTINATTVVRAKNGLSALHVEQPKARKTA
jgi:hypothetical protein